MLECSATAMLLPLGTYYIRRRALSEMPLGDEIGDYLVPELALHKPCSQLCTGPALLELKGRRGGDSPSFQSPLFTLALGHTPQEQYWTR